MNTQVTAETVLDLAHDRNRVAHLTCGSEHQLPDEPTHGLCGHPLIGVDAPNDAPHCPDCEARMNQGGGPIAAFIGALHCDQHSTRD